MIPPKDGPGLARLRRHQAYLELIADTLERQRKAMEELKALRKEIEETKRLSTSTTRRKRTYDR